MNLHDVSLQDWIALAVGILGLVTAYLSRKTQLPAWARKWLKKVGSDTIMAIIVKAETFASMSYDDRRKWAVTELKVVVLEKCGLKLPDSIGNLLVEFIFQAWKKSRK